MSECCSGLFLAVSIGILDDWPCPLVVSSPLLEEAISAATSSVSRPVGRIDRDLLGEKAQPLRSLELQLRYCDDLYVRKGPDVERGGLISRDDIQTFVPHVVDRCGNISRRSDVPGTVA